MTKTLVAILLLTLIDAGTTMAAETLPPPYAGLEKRDIKALSTEEMTAYREGKGMGLAKVAELNHYPGPAHVLALAKELALTSKQRTQTETLFKSMETEAVALGQQLIEQERQLDVLFANRTITREKLQQSLEAIAVLQGRVRQAHLQTHLAQAEILDVMQIRKYDELRGYAETANSAHHAHPMQR